jgi:hypothetical protein
MVDIEVAVVGIIALAGAAVAALTIRSGPAAAPAVAAEPVPAEPATVPS